IHLLDGQQLAAMSRMSLLSTDAPAGGLFTHRRRRPGRIGRGRQRGVGAVAIELLFQLQKTLAELIDLPLGGAQLLLQMTHALMQTMVLLPQTRAVGATFLGLRCVIRHIPSLEGHFSGSRGLNGYSVDP